MMVSPDPNLLYSRYYESFVEDILADNPFTTYGEVKRQLDDKIKSDFESSLSPGDLSSLSRKQRSSLSKKAANLAKGPMTLMKKNDFLKKKVSSSRVSRWQAMWEQSQAPTKLAGYQPDWDYFLKNPSKVEKLVEGKLWGAQYFKD